MDGLGDNLAALGHVLEINAAPDAIRIIYKSVELEEHDELLAFILSFSLAVLTANV